MKFKEVLEQVFCEEKIIKSFEYKKLLTSQSYYFLLSSFKVAILLKKEGLEDNKRHWVIDELIGNTFHWLVIYYEGVLSSKEIFDSLMYNFPIDYKRVLKETSRYKKFLTKNDISEENMLSLATEVYGKFSKWIVNIKNDLKKSNTFEIKKEFVEKTFDIEI